MKLILTITRSLLAPLIVDMPRFANNMVCGCGGLNDNFQYGKPYKDCKPCERLTDGGSDE